MRRGIGVGTALAAVTVAAVTAFGWWRLEWWLATRGKTTPAAAEVTAPAEPRSTPMPAVPFATATMPRDKALSRSAFGVRVGESTVVDVKAFADARGFDCKDASMKAVMARYAERRAAKGVDAVSKASARKKPRPENPQVRLSCEGVLGTALGDRDRPPSDGRLLFVFPAPDQPLQHVSYQRTHRTIASALADLEESDAAVTALQGRPSGIGPLPVDLPYLAPTVREWHFQDLHVKLSALNLGKRGIAISEEIELPAAPATRPVLSNLLGRTLRQ